MSDLPTLIILATPTPPAPDNADVAPGSALPDFQQIAQTLDVAQEAGLDVVLAASRWVKQQCAVFAPEVLCLETDVLSPPFGDGRNWVRAVGQAVQASPHASGWLVMPMPLATVRPHTLQALCMALRHAALVCPCHQMHQGHPLGFSAEFFSELLALQTDAQWRRLLSRYPVEQVETDDPGVLPWAQAGRPRWQPLDGQAGSNRRG